jgi:hypothetical protein
MNVSYLATCITVGVQKLCDGFPGPAQGQEWTIALLVAKIMGLLFPVLGVLLFFILVAAGYDYILSWGEAKKIEDAWNKITYALVGYGILIGSYVAVRVIATILGYDSPV